MLRIVPLSDLSINPEHQHRENGIDSSWVEHLASVLRENPDEDLPPVSAVFDGTVYHLWDGFHRVVAYQNAGRTEITVSYTTGAAADSYVCSLGANATNGKQRTSADIEKAIKSALGNSLTRHKSDRELAKLIGVSQPTVSKYRHRLSDNALSDAPAHRTVTRKGTTYQMDTAPIGRTPKAPAVDDVDEPEEPPAPKAETNGKHTGNGKAEANGKHEPEPLTDTAGVEIPERVAEAFTTAKAIAALCGDIDAVLKRAEELARSFGGRLIRIESVRQQLKDAKGNLWANRATHVCPYCHGEEQAPCEVCKGEGWTAKHIYEQSPGNNKRAKRA